MEEKYCQSCGMPLNDTELYGTEADGSKTEEYCKYCYEGGKYTDNYTMEEMIAACAGNMAEANKEMDVEEAKKMMREFLPHLKRWQTQ